MDYVTPADLRAALATLPTREDIRVEIRTGLEPYATREDVGNMIRLGLAPYPTREEMRQEIRSTLEPYATRQELREEGERTRRHMDVLFESLRDDIRLLAESQAALLQRIDDVRIELKGDVAAVDRRVMRLEATRH
jgi:hypothetical protein